MNQAAIGGWRFSVCICTRNRPDDLRKALASCARSAYPVHQVVVSDDSTDARTRMMVAAEFPSATFVEGPRKGLGANRNVAVAAATGSHVLFIDDDVILSPDFLGRVAQRLDCAADPQAVIVSGTELNHGKRVLPHKATFLGYQAIDYTAGEAHETIVINATVFPRAIFDRALFDASLVYGSEELDFAVRATRLHGLAIDFVPDASNEHYPSQVNRDFYQAFHEASRIYVQFKRFWWVERSPPKAIAFMAVAHAHLLAHCLRRQGLAGFAAFGTTARRAFRYIRDCFRASAQYV